MRYLLTVLLLIATPAIADPCDAPVKSFKAGQTFKGTVRYVGDGDSICVGPTADPTTWVEVRLGNWNAPELNEARGRAARETTRQVALGRQAVCMAGGGRHGRVVSYDRVIATCRIDGRDLAELLAARGAPQGGR